MSKFRPSFVQIKNARRTNIKTKQPLRVLAVAAVLLFVSLMPAWAQTELLVNPGFELGASSGWTANTLPGGTSGSAGILQGSYPRSGGTWYGYVGNVNNALGSLYQFITIPANATSVTLTFYLNVKTAEPSVGIPPYDVMDVNVRSTSDVLLRKLTTYSEADKGSNVDGNYVLQGPFDLSDFRGQTVLLQFYCDTDASNVTIFRIDDVSVQAILPTISAPTVSTLPADEITTTSAQMNGTVNPNAADTTVYFQYGLTTAYGNNTGTADFGSGTLTLAAVLTLSGLTPNTTYHYQFVAYNSAGARFGGDVPFTTLNVPCSYSLDSYNASPGSGSGSSSFNVIAGNGCGWTASSDATSWLHTSSSGPGNGPVNYTYDGNTSTSSRTGHITVQDQTFTVTQAGVSLASMVFGVDISACQQKTINWSQVIQASVTDGGQSFPITFAYIRASKGRANLDNCEFKDPQFSTFAQAAVNTGVVVGAYHVAAVINPSGGMFSPDDEADYFVSVAGGYIKVGNLRPALDIEDSSSCGNTARSIGWPALSAWVDEWMQEVHRLTGVTPIMYCSEPYKSGLGTTLSSKYELWVAQVLSPPNPDLTPNSSPWTTSALYQYSWSGTVGGMQGQTVCPGCCNTLSYVDMDVFQGSQQKFQSKLIIGTPSGTTRIVSVSPSLSSVQAGDTFTIDATINSSQSQTTLIGSSLVPSGTTSGYINDPSHDTSVILNSGNNNVSRQFTVPAATTAGIYDLLFAVWQDSNGDGQISSADTLLAGPTIVSSALTVTAPSDSQGPALEIISPANNATVTSASLPVIGTATDSGRGNNGIASVAVNGMPANGGTTNAAYTAYWSTTITLTTPGANTITVVAMDTLQNATNVQITVIYTPPDTVQTITFDQPADKTYGEAVFTLIASASSGLPVFFTVLSGPAMLSSQNSLTLTGAGAVTVSATQPGDAEWLAAMAVPRTFSVAKAPLTATADDKTKVQSSPNPPLTISYNGFVNSDSSSVLGVPPMASTTADTSSPVGAYPITLSGGSDSNYTFLFQSGTLTITTDGKQLTGVSFSDGMFHFVLNGRAGDWYVVQASSDLANWTPISTNMIPAGGSVAIADAFLPGQAHRFYRAVAVGAPPVQNLVVNGDFELGNTDFTSEYQVDAQLASGGQYRMGSTSRDYPGDAVGGDHTTGHGLMMVVNGAGPPIAVWVQTVQVAPNTSYALSAWAASWSNPDKSPAQIQFEINDSPVGLLTMPSSAVASLWQPFSVTWNSGSSASAAIRIVDLNAVLDGNDFCLDDINLVSLAIQAPSIVAKP